MMMVHGMLEAGSVDPLWATCEAIFRRTNEPINREQNLTTYIRKLMFIVFTEEC